MEPAERAVLIHMLRAQREQINASLALLEKEEPPPPSTRPERPVFGRTREQT